MEIQKQLEQIQAALGAAQIDGWLLYDNHGTNPIARKILGLCPSTLVTRRFVYWIPRRGQPLKLVHHIEAQSLEHIPGKELRYRAWSEFTQKIAELLAGAHVVAMEYSPLCRIPSVSLVDGGFLESVRACGVEVVSSADILQQFTSVLEERQIRAHKEAAQVVQATVQRVWELIGEHVRTGKEITEYDVQKFILSEFAAHNCIAEDGPICAVNEHAALPHYQATKESAKTLGAGDFVLIDLWCKLDVPWGIYADITRVAVLKPTPTPLEEEVFQIVLGAQQLVIQKVKEAFHAKEPLTGAFLDSLCRDYITARGYGDYFLHRTGHSIDTSVHGSGVNLDNLESADQRTLLPGMCFSVEPAIYLPNQFGIRLESDILIHPTGEVEVTGGLQEILTCLS